jgi:hypothetical protein
MAVSAVRGTHTVGSTTIRASALSDGNVRLRIGPRRGTRGATRIINLDSEKAARLVEQLGAAIAIILANSVKASN